MLNKKNYLKEKVERYFKGRGCRILLKKDITLPDKVYEMVDCIVQDGNNVVLVKILDELSSLSKFRDYILELSQIKCFADKMYVAVDEESEVFVDGVMLHKAGIGLLIVNVRGVQEKLPAKPTRFKIAYQTPDLKRFEQKIFELTSKIEKLFEQNKRFNERLTYIENKIRSLELRLRALEEKAPAPTRVEEAVSKEVETTLPSFIRDNPWLEILARRGSE